MKLYHKYIAFSFDLTRERRTERMGGGKKKSKLCMNRLELVRILKQDISPVMRAAAMTGGG